MPKYEIRRDYQGYVRGFEVREITAGSMDEALANFHRGTVISEDIVRDDTSTTDMSIEEIHPPKPPVVLTPTQQRLLDFAMSLKGKKQ